MYDYIIVGAGTAGCVLAGRLSEDPDVRVLVLEAGGPDTSDSIHVPVAFGTLFKTALDWDYSSAPEPMCNRRRVYLPRGKTLGGCSSCNAMVYIRGNRIDYDEWRDLGNPGWGYDDLLPYFKRAEDNERGASEYHGAGGPLSVSDGRSRNVMMPAFLEAAQGAGLAANDDFNAAEQDGVGLYQVTQRGGRRCSAAVAYLHPAMQRPNLTVETHVQVHRVLFEGGRAVGVSGSRLGETLEFRCEREVILSGGAYNSPQLLMLSGVGPAAVLGALQIPVVADLPGVGRNLQDHPLCGAVWTTSEPVSLLTAATAENFQAFVESGTGPLTSNIAEAGAFHRTQAGMPAPDIQLLASPVMYLDEGLTPPPDHGFTIVTTILKPGSRGEVTLASADPTAKPLIRHNYYTTPEDLRSMSDGIRLLVEIGSRPELARYCERAHQVPESMSDADVAAFLARNTLTNYHPAGTCRMGSDAGAVVSAELLVHGVDGLRVVDASIMPAIIRGNTNAPTIAIAERAADLIRALDAPIAEAGTLAGSTA
ncbi:MAG TPA: GMC family oxidoreductase N-terminal domain-containing protein [Candidatus Dormibacteraeota bacterium]|nr:GMC family oxidoreductase N-terminal domain-containing protein [Candidatus Dormibacteraeota bacterium]